MSCRFPRCSLLCYLVPGATELEGSPLSFFPLLATLFAVFHSLSMFTSLTNFMLSSSGLRLFPPVSAPGPFSSLDVTATWPIQPLLNPGTLKGTPTKQRILWTLHFTLFQDPFFKDHTDRHHGRLFLWCGYCWQLYKCSTLQEVHSLIITFTKIHTFLHF